MIVAEWWHYDELAKTLFYETAGKTPELKVAETVITPTAVETAWEGISREGETILLWNDKELSPGKSLVAEVKDWDFNVNLKPVKIRGNYQDGGYFEDSIRLLIPLTTGSFIAISIKNRRYYLRKRKQETGKKGVFCLCNKVSNSSSGGLLKTS